MGPVPPQVRIAHVGGAVPAVPVRSSRRFGGPRAMASRAAVVCTIALILAAAPMTIALGRQARDAAQDPGETEKGLVYQRKVQLAVGSALPAIVMTEFLTHGELAAGGSNLAVRDGRNTPVPWRILQSGPGDYCRLAFQTVPKQHVYKIYYGGKGAPGKPPPWTGRDGLLLETRHWKNCDLARLDSVREAFHSSEPYGTAFVPAVFHRFNPFWPDPEPFLSEYRGALAHLPGREPTASSRRARTAASC